MEAKKLEELKIRASGLAEKYEREYGGCTQCVLAAIMETLGGISDEVFKAGTGLAGGIGLSGNSCGALTGGVMALSCYLGRDYEHFADPDRERINSYHLAARLQQKFEEEYGTSVCQGIQTKIMGRSFNLWDPKDNEAFLDAGGHRDKCPSVCARAAAFVIDILNEEDLI